jgi:hypothetical protein
MALVLDDGVGQLFTHSSVYNEGVGNIGVNKIIYIVDEDFSQSALNSSRWTTGGTGTQNVLNGNLDMLNTKYVRSRASVSTTNSEEITIEAHVQISKTDVRDSYNIGLADATNDNSVLIRFVGSGADPMGRLFVQLITGGGTTLFDMGYVEIDTNHIIRLRVRKTQAIAEVDGMGTAIDGVPLGISYNLLITQTKVGANIESWTDFVTLKVQGL